MNYPKNNVESISKKVNKDEIKYLPCIRLLELYDNCMRIKENNQNYKKDNCTYLLTSAVMKCGIS